jgi:hypothetical protein
MPQLMPPPVPLSKIGRAAHDVGLAGLLGGNLFGRLALHPSVTEISDPAERGKVVNAAWRRYGTIQTLSLAAVTVGWLGARADEAAGYRLGDREKRLAQARDVLLGAVTATGLATALEGVRFSKLAPEGGVPLSDGDHAAPSANAKQTAAKRRLNALGLATLVSEVALVGVNAAFSQESFRRPPAKRFFMTRLR